jgi:hypothetical protein
MQGGGMQGGGMPPAPGVGGSWYKGYNPQGNAGALPGGCGGARTRTHIGTSLRACVLGPVTLLSCVNQCSLR